MEILDRVNDVQQKHGTARQLLVVLANNYFNAPPKDKTEAALFAKDYDDMSELITAILEYSNAVRDSLNALYCIADNNVKGD